MVSRVAFTVFGYPVYWYGIFIASSILLGITLATREERRIGLKSDTMLDMTMFFALPLAIICARLYYVAFSWQEYASNPIRILYINEGGIAIYGAVIGGILGVWLYGRWKKIPFLLLADIGAPCLILGQAIGRWGNFTNQEAFGFLVSNPKLQFFPFAVFIEASQTWHLATFFYESILNFATFAVLWFYFKNRKKHRGDVFVWYFILYGATRSVVEGLRLDSLWFGPMRISQVLSWVMLLAGALWFTVRWYKGRKAQLEQGKNASPVLIVVSWIALIGATAAALAIEFVLSRQLGFELTTYVWQAVMAVILVAANVVIYTQVPRPAEQAPQSVEPEALPDQTAPEAEGAPI